MHNVLHIVRNPVLGGAEVLVKNIINANDGQDFRHFLLYSKKGPLLELIDEKQTNRLLKCTVNNRILFILKLRNIIKKRNIDIVHIHQSIDTIHVILARIGLKIKLVRSYHGYEGIDLKRKSESIRSKLIKIILNKYETIYRSFNLHLFVSKSLLNVFMSNYKKYNTANQKVLYNGVNPVPLLKQEKTDICKDFNLPPQSLVMGMIGSFNSVRDHITVCKAIKKIIKQKPETHFLFVGKFSPSNKSYNNCFKFCDDNNLCNNVHFVGEKKDIANIIKSLHLYIHSSNTDTFGIALVEAMIAGVPCLASDIPPFLEVSDNGKHVTLFRKGDVEDLIEKINCVLTKLNSIELSEKCKKARQYAVKNFSIQTHLNHLHSYYSEMLKT